jgi:hypothetical protein
MGLGPHVTVTGPYPTVHNVWRKGQIRFWGGSGAGYSPPRTTTYIQGKPKVQIQTTANKGIRITIGDWDISAQWGPGNYCDNYDLDNLLRNAVNAAEAAPASRKVEVAVIRVEDEAWVDADGNVGNTACHVWSYIPIRKVLDLAIALDNLLVIDDADVGKLCKEHLTD